MAIRDVPPFQVRDMHLLVRTTASLISAGTERMVVEFARKSLVAKAHERPDLVRKVLEKAQRDGIAATLQSVVARLNEPAPLGYSAAGVVKAVGGGLEGRFHVGDRVAIAGAGVANHAEESLVPVNLVAPIPSDVADVEACFGTVASVALNGVRLVRPQLGDLVGVVGVGLVGQLAVQLLALHGCRVASFDFDPRKLELAKSMGAELVWNLSDGDPAESVLSATHGIGCDAVIIAAATDSSAPFETAAAIARDRAVVSLVGVTGTEFPYRDYMKKELSVVVARSYGPGRYDPDYERRHVKYPVGWVRWTETENLAECVRLMRRENKARLDVAALTTHRFDFNEAEAAYKLVAENVEPYLGVVLRYPEAAEARFVAVPAVVGRRETRDCCVLGMVGAGSFARTKLLPALNANRQVVLRTIATRRGMSADDSKSRFGFRRCTTDEEDVFGDPEINAVLIAGPHSSHASLAARALQAGKSVLVEKPLGLTREQLMVVAGAREGSNGFFQVGFNRRFAPMSIKARDRLRSLGGAKTILLRVNAGQLPPDSWQSEAEEGRGRVLGEMCHFVDLARFLIGAPIVSLHAEAAQPSRGNPEDVSVNIRFADGSLATVFYTALGDTSYSKERIECFGGGSVIAIDDFCTIEFSSGGRRRTQRTSQDKGHKAEIASFVRSVVAGGPPDVPEVELLETSLAAIAVLESLASGNTVSL
jgi:predicted dehydrogenase/threonine dehydrogenase-like Zn-dependent dehydrogenase